MIIFDILDGKYNKTVSVLMGLSAFFGYTFALIKITPYSWLVGLPIGLVVMIGYLRS